MPCKDCELLQAENRALRRYIAHMREELHPAQSHSSRNDAAWTTCDQATAGALFAALEDSILRGETDES